MKKKKVVVVGGSGHIGSYLIPMLVTRGYETVVFSRRNTKPYPASLAWREVVWVDTDREIDEKNGRWAELLEEHSPDILVDIICFEPESARLLREVFVEKETHLLSCGTVWVYGKTEIVPTPEWASRFPQNDYSRKKMIIEKELLEATSRGEIRATVIHPGHITGPGKPFITPFGDNNPRTIQQIINGEEIFLLDGGLSTLHHVHPRDVAALFFRALELPRFSVRESFNCCGSHALTFLGLGRYLARLLGVEFRYQSISLEEYEERFGFPEMAALHVRQGCCVSMDKARELLNFLPSYSPEEAVREAVEDLLKKGILKETNDEHI
ncbi:MAG TPA: NAD-dependent epimerase/dehydratase family protein [Atribacteraceae bacterium]|nr:NAD-dependent epimerase/dehydratase family protein [Atribacteraceae bacterium]